MWHRIFPTKFIIISTTDWSRCFWFNPPKSSLSNFRYTFWNCYFLNTSRISESFRSNTFYTIRNNNLLYSVITIIKCIIWNCIFPTEFNIIATTDRSCRFQLWTIIEHAFPWIIHTFRNNNIGKIVTHPE